MDVLVTEGRKPVVGLNAADFELRDNGVAQAVTLIDGTDVPLNVVLALDTSASATGARQAQLVAAGNALLDGLRSDDRAALITFSHAVVPRLPLTSDLDAVRSSLRRIEPSGRTALMDATYVALTTTLGEPGRSLVVVFTDAADISSWLQPDEVVECAKRSSAVLYAVTSTDSRRSSSLEDLTRTTGGDLLRVTPRADLSATFQQILETFRSRYVLVYTAAGVARGGYHRLDVRVRRRGAAVKARPGYVGTEPTP